MSTLLIIQVGIDIHDAYMHTQRPPPHIHIYIHTHRAKVQYAKVIPMYVQVKSSANTFEI